MVKINSDFQEAKDVEKTLMNSPRSNIQPGIQCINSIFHFSVIADSLAPVFLQVFHPGETNVLYEAEMQRNDAVYVHEARELPSSFEYIYHRGDPTQTLIDPYAKRIASPFQWGEHLRQSEEEALSYPFRNLYIQETQFNWEGDTQIKIPQNELIIYEMHLKSFTADASSQVEHPGSFLGCIEKIPYLKDLGVNAVEFLPLFEFNEGEYLRYNPFTGQRLYNYWGYSSLSFFAPMRRYAISDAVLEFKEMVKAMHKAGIEVILDVVYNHTGESVIKKPGSISFKGLDAHRYYQNDYHGDFLNFTGCGNTFNANDPLVCDFIMDSLRYWVEEMHVDGFRFDLASTFVRNKNGHPMADAPILKAIEEDPVLSRVKLIAEPWDATGLYHVGRFGINHSSWSEWNGRYRDDVRRFIKGTDDYSGAFAVRMCGSQDLYGGNRTPCHSINFITCHDGFSLQDLVSYNDKHNSANGEDSRDGNNSNDSWNCGSEGLSSDPKITHLRERQTKNFTVALLSSFGTPMLNMGDEYAHSKKGNNNTWCHNNELNYFDWKQMQENHEMYRFFKEMIKVRKNESLYHRDEFLAEDDITWHGMQAHAPAWNPENRFLAYTLKKDGADEYYLAFNAFGSCQHIEFPNPPEGKEWHWLVNTARPSPDDITPGEAMKAIDTPFYSIKEYSSLILKCI
jgi:isoamylase